jgi:hypothetical protein
MDADMSGRTMGSGHVLNIDGLLVAETEVDDGAQGRNYRGRLLLFRNHDPKARRRRWTLLELRHVNMGTEPPLGFGVVSDVTAGDLLGIRDWVVDLNGVHNWRALVRAGAGNDPELRALWIPVQINLDLQASSLYHRGLRVREDGRRPKNWRRAALGEAVARLLPGLGFVVTDSDTDVRAIFPDGLPHWERDCYSTAVKYGYRVNLVSAIDGAGEIHVRAADPCFDPGADQRHAPCPLAEEELLEVRRLTSTEDVVDVEAPLQPPFVVRWQD